MKTLLAFLALWVCFVPASLAQKGDEGDSPCDRLDPVFQSLNFDENEITVHEDVVYSDFTPTHPRHKVDLYVPPLDPECNDRPFIMLIHGGAFKDGDKSGFNPMAMNYARRGYCVAVPNYRLNLCQDRSFNCDECDSDQDCYNLSTDCAKCDYAATKSSGVNIVDRNWYKATQDCEAALRFSHLFFTNLGVNIIKTFILGKSAGGVIALHMAYADQAEINAYDPAIAANLGPLTATVFSGLGNYTVTIDAISEVSGALMDPTFMDTEQTDLIMFHGDCDKVVPYCRSMCVNSGAKNAYGSGYIAHRIDNTSINTLNYRLFSFINVDNGHKTFMHSQLIESHSVVFFSQIIQSIPFGNTKTSVENGVLGTNIPPCN